jgi:hypothetical protein
MATSKKGGTKTEGKKIDKHRRKKGLVGSDPIIITGGSIMVSFKPDFDDDSSIVSRAARLKVKKVKSPVSDLEITGVKVTDMDGNVLCLYTLPDYLKGACIIRIKAQ